MASLYPNMAAPEDFKPGDCVRKFVTEWNVTPFVGVVTHIIPATYKVWVQWPIEHSCESPETLVKVNPAIYGMPTVMKDHGYSSYEKELSEKLYGRIPKLAANLEKMAIRVAHTFATDVVGKLVDDIVLCKDQELSDVQAYNRIFEKYANICSDYIIQSSIKKVYAGAEKVKRFSQYTPEALPDTKEAEIAQEIVNKIKTIKGLDFFHQSVGPGVSWGIPNSFAIMYQKGSFGPNQVSAALSVIKKSTGLICTIRKGTELIDRIDNVTPAQGNLIKETIEAMISESEKESIKKVYAGAEKVKRFSQYTPEALPDTKEAEIAQEIVNKIKTIKGLDFLHQSVGPEVSWGIPNSFAIMYQKGSFGPNQVRAALSVIKKSTGLIYTIRKGKELIGRINNVTPAQGNLIKETIEAVISESEKESK